MYVIRHTDLAAAIDPKRKLVKVTDPNLWKPPLPEGQTVWQKGYEIRCDGVGVSLFTTGTNEKLHYHERCWEIYQVLRGSLRIAVKAYRNAEWAAQVLQQLDMIVLAPGTLHLVDSTSDHVSQVVQAPPALSDQVEIDDEEEKTSAMIALRSVQTS